MDKVGIKLGSFEFEMDEVLFIVMIMGVGVFVTIALIIVTPGGC